MATTEWIRTTEIGNANGFRLLGGGFYLIKGTAAPSELSQLPFAIQSGLAIEKSKAFPDVAAASFQELPLVSAETIWTG